MARPVFRDPRPPASHLWPWLPLVFALLDLEFVILSFKPLSVSVKIL